MTREPWRILVLGHFCEEVILVYFVVRQMVFYSRVNNTHPRLWWAAESNVAVLCPRNFNSSLRNKTRY